MPGCPAPDWGYVLPACTAKALVSARPFCMACDSMAQSDQSLPGPRAHSGCGGSRCVWQITCTGSARCNGAHPRAPASLCSSVGFRTDFTIEGGLRLAWYIMYDKNVITSTVNRYWCALKFLPPREWMKRAIPEGRRLDSIAATGRTTTESEGETREVERPAPGKETGAVREPANARAVDLAKSTTRGERVPLE